MADIHLVSWLFIEYRQLMRDADSGRSVGRPDAPRRVFQQKQSIYIPETLPIYPCLTDSVHSLNKIIGTKLNIG